ncbi:MAG: hypothetical protein J4432_05335 [DPANN group archaeon]|nr:hypothetical protein [DPANN group archaeon]
MVDGRGSTGRGFVFSFDAVVGLVFMILFGSFIISYLDQSDFSQYRLYERYAAADSGLTAIIASGSVQTAVNESIQVGSQTAGATLRGVMGLLEGGARYQLQIEVFNSTAKYVDISESTPRGRIPTTRDTVLVSRKVFSYGGDYGIATLRTW